MSGDPRINALADEFYRRGGRSELPFEQLPAEHQARWREQAIVMLTYLDSLVPAPSLDADQP